MAVLLLLVSISACSTNKSDEKNQTTEVSETKKEEKTSQPQTEAEEKETSEKREVVKNTDYGYEIEYNPNVFQYYYAEGTDNYTPVDEAIEKNGPVYVAVQLLKDSDAATIAKNFQAGSDEGEITKVNIGAKDYPADYIYTESKIDKTTQFVKRYVLQHKKDVLLIEIGGYKGMDETVLEEVESMLGSLRME